MACGIALAIDRAEKSQRRRLPFILNILLPHGRLTHVARESHPAGEIAPFSRPAVGELVCVWKAR
jgi:hypothetical protein